MTWGVRTVKQNWYMSWPLCLKTQTEQWPQRPLHLLLHLLHLLLKVPVGAQVPAAAAALPRLSLTTHHHLLQKMHIAGGERILGSTGVHITCAPCT